MPQVGTTLLRSIFPCSHSLPGALDMGCASVLQSAPGNSAAPGVFIKGVQKHRQAGFRQAGILQSMCFYNTV
jgi:hypothetical protein